MVECFTHTCVHTAPLQHGFLKGGVVRDINSFYACAVMNSSDGVDRLISILGDALSRSRAQRLLSDAGGNVETAVNAYFSDPTPSLESATPRARLQSLLGNLISQRRLDDLLAASGGNLERAVDIHFSSAGNPYSLAPLHEEYLPILP